MGKKGKKQRKPAGPHKAPSTPQADALFGLACGHHQRGDLVAAEQGYRDVVKQDARRGDAWRNLGALLRGRGAYEEGRLCTEQALKLDSSDPSLWGNYGNVLRDLGQLEESVKAFQRGLQAAPDSMGLLQGLAISLGRMGEPQQVIDLLTPVVEEARHEGSSNAVAELLLELGNAHHALGQGERALQRWQQGAHRAEGDKRLHIGLNIAQSLCGLKRFQEATEVCQGLEPLFQGNANLAYAKGIIAKGLGNLQEAEQLFQAALRADPGYIICLNSYGLLLRDIGRSHQARECFESALRHKPEFGAAMNNLGSVLKDVARYEEALSWLRKGAEQLGNSPAARSNVLFTLVGYELEPAEARYAEAQRFAQQVDVHPYERWKDRVLDPCPTRRLKVGLVSPDLCRHAVSYFLEPLLENWDRSEVEITLYSCGEQQDDYTLRLQEKCDHWRDLRGESDELCIAQIQRDEIDILIDLAGHTAGNRLALFAAKPAPIQATYLGYYGTTGLRQVDYWITDEVLHPPERDTQDPASEERWRLDRCYVSYRPSPTAPEVRQPPCLEKGYVTFGSFNQSRKITPQTATHWMTVLNAVPGSRLLLKSKNLGEPIEQERIRTLFGKLGLEDSRLELHGHSASIDEHLGRYHDVDIALDTFPYTGCTTTADALWMGVPVLTVAGQSMVSRQAAAVLAGADRGNWICETAEEMALKAKRIIEDKGQLTRIRMGQRESLHCTALMDPKGLAEALEKSFRRWWQEWLENQEAGSGMWRQPNKLTDGLANTATCSILNSPALKIPLWIGNMPPEMHEEYTILGYEIYQLRSIKPWRECFEPFEQTKRGVRAVAIIEGSCRIEAKKELRRWQDIYPQLQWQLME